MMELNFVKLNALIIGRNLKIQRIQAGLTQENIAEHIGVSAQQISNWESGKTLINLTRLIELSLLYQVDLYTLWDRNVSRLLCRYWFWNLPEQWMVLRPMK